MLNAMKNVLCPKKGRRFVSVLNTTLTCRMIGSVETKTFVSNGKKIASNVIQIPDVDFCVV